MFAEIGLLVLEGDAAGLAAKVSALSPDRDRREEGGGDHVGAAVDARGAGGKRDGREASPEGGDADRGRSPASSCDNGHPTRRGTPEPLVHSQDS